MKNFILLLVFMLSSMLISAQKIFLISAMSSDSNIYTNIHISSPYQIHHVAWLKPFENESLESYCGRLIEINNISEEDIIIGTSFGALVATIIGKTVRNSKTILISGFSTKDEKPFKFKFLKIFPFHRMIPRKWLKSPRMIISKCFGKVTPEERAFLTEMIRGYDTDLIFWSIDQIVKFDNTIQPPGLVKINGSRDRTFNTKGIHRDILLDGTHLMVYNQAELISAVLNGLLNSDDLIAKINSTGASQSSQP